MDADDYSPKALETFNCFRDWSKLDNFIKRHEELLVATEKCHMIPVDKVNEFLSHTAKRVPGPRAPPGSSPRVPSPRPPPGSPPARSSPELKKFLENFGKRLDIAM